MNPLPTTRLLTLTATFLLASTAFAAPPSSAPSPAPAPAPDAAPAPAPAPEVALSPAPSPRVLHYIPPPVPPSEGAAVHETNPNDAKLLHGFRLGYSFDANYDKPVPSLGGQSLAQKADMRSPSHFLVGYEVFYRMVGHSWLNVILVANANVAGLEQAKFYPSGNLLIAAELQNSFQIGVGAHLEPLAGSEAHMIVAAGWTPRVGSFYVPLHAFFIPDVDGVHRMGVTTGVTW